MRVRDTASALVSAVLLLSLQVLAARPCAAQLPGTPQGAPQIPSILGDWKVSSGQPAPWVSEAAATKLDTTQYSGKTVSFESKRIAGPTAFACGAPKYTPSILPAEGLFQGNLPAPAAAAAAGAGVTTLPAPTAQVSCSRGLFDYHFVGDDSLYIALDNVVWKLSRIPTPVLGTGAGTNAGTIIGDGPSAVVQALFADHFKHDMAFTAESTQRKERWLSKGLLQKIRAYLARPDSGDEVPSINGDPFTDSQEYPTEFKVGDASVDQATASVKVMFTLAGAKSQLELRLAVEDQAWKITDVRYQEGSTLTELLND